MEKLETGIGLVLSLIGALASWGGGEVLTKVFGG
jgi:hypothetical protein